MSQRTSDPPVSRPRPEWLTLPNVVTLARLLVFIPVTTWVILAGDAPLTATVLLVLFGCTDWIDGFLARQLNQISRLGQILDPLADRIGVVLISAALLVAGLLPWWVLAIIVAVDMILFVIGVTRLKAMGRLKVAWVGKIRTAILMVSLPMLTLGASDLAVAPIVRILALALLAVGCVLHVLAGIVYVRILVREGHPSPLPEAD